MFTIYFSARSGCQYVAADGIEAAREIWDCLSEKFHMVSARP